MVAVIILALVVLWPQRATLAASLAALKHAQIGYAVLALSATITTYILAAVIYLTLVKYRIRWQEMWLVQVATALTSRLVPIGIGTMGLTAFFLHRRKHSTAEALAVVAANNAIGVLGHIVLLCVVLTNATLPQKVSIHASTYGLYVVGILAVVVCIVGLVAPGLRKRALHGIASLGHAIVGYRHRPRRLAYALLASMLLSLVYVMALAYSTRALGLNIPYSTVFLIYTFSMLTGVITPTPGGLVGVEAGIVGGFVAYGIDAKTGLSVALLYRFISYWLPLLPGFVAFRIMQRRIF